jgi:hypothetical protein
MERMTKSRESGASLFNVDEIETKPKEENPVKQFMKYFFDSFEKVHGKKYVANFGKDGKIAKDLLKIIPLGEAKLLVDRFLTSKDTFIVNSGFTFGVFRSQINKLRVNNGSMQTSRKQRLENADSERTAAIKWQE